MCSGRDDSDGIVEAGRVRPLKLHLGCYQKKIYGFVNIDIRPEVDPDLVDDVFVLNKIKPNSVDLIYACHVLEHAKHDEAFKALKRWYEVLKIGGKLRVCVPDLQAVFKYYQTSKRLGELYSFIYGSQKHPYDIHYTGWDFDTLWTELNHIGFKDIGRYDWRDTEHFYIDDYSQCYLPQMEYKTRRKEGRITGTLLSLNVEATKE